MKLTRTKAEIADQRAQNQTRVTSLELEELCMRHFGFRPWFFIR